MESRIPFLPWLHLGCDLEDLDMAKRCEVGVWVFDVRSLQLLMEVFCFFFCQFILVVVTPPEVTKMAMGKITMFFFFRCHVRFQGCIWFIHVYPSISVYMWFEGLLSSTIINTRPWICFRVPEFYLCTGMFTITNWVCFLFRSILMKQLFET